jgi:protease IV
MDIARRISSGLIIIAAGALALIGLTQLITVFVHHPVGSAEVAGGALVVALLVIAIVSRLAPSVPSATVLELDLSSPPAEVSGRQPLAALNRRRALTLPETVAVLSRASRDKRVRGLVLRPRFAFAPQAVVEELRDALTAFRRAGKFTVAVTDSFGEGGPANAAYYLATACDEVVVHPTGLVGLSPLSVDRNFYRGLLDRLGVEVEVLARGEFKSALNPLAERGFTGPDREQQQRILESLWEQQINDVAHARNLTTEQVRRLADTAPLLAGEALTAGLVDRVAYTDEVVAGCKASAGSRARLLYLAVYRRRAGKGRERGSSASVGVLRAVGEIHRSSIVPFGLTGGPVLAADSLITQIRSAARDKKIAACVLRIDSPGGSAVASDAIWRELMTLRAAGKPLVVSMGSVAASGGYYLAAAADRVVAQPGTITGSIGVITMHPVLAQAKAKLDVHYGEVHTGAEPSMFSVNRPLSAAQHQRIDAHLDEVYETFTQRVAEGRKLPLERVLEVAKGRVWTGADAVDIGLVDELGGVERAMALAVELSGAPAGTKPRAKPIPRAPGPLGRLRPRRPQSSDDTAQGSASANGVLRSLERHGVRAHAAELARYRVMSHLGCDPRAYWLP